MEPWNIEGPRDWQNMFAITRFLLLGRGPFWRISFTITGIKKIFRYTEDFIIFGFLKWRFHYSTCLRDNRASSKILTFYFNCDYIPSMPRSLQPIRARISSWGAYHFSELASQTNAFVRRITLLIRAIQPDTFIPKWHARMWWALVKTDFEERLNNISFPNYFGPDFCKAPLFSYFVIRFKQQNSIKTSEAVNLVTVIFG